MSSFNRLIIITLTSLFFLQACGFLPALDEKTPVQKILQHTTVNVTGEKEGFVLEHMLRKKIGDAQSSPDYELLVNLNITINKGVASTEGRPRYNVTGTADIEFVDSASGDRIFIDTITGYSSWIDTGQSISNLMARIDAEGNMLNQLADRIYTSLLINAGTQQQ